MFGVNEAVLQPVPIAGTVGARRMVLDRVMGLVGWDSSAGDGPDADIGGGDICLMRERLPFQAGDFLRAPRPSLPGCRGGGALPVAGPAPAFEQRFAGCLFQIVCKPRVPTGLC
jgi:hypothetical protein